MADMRQAGLLRVEVKKKRKGKEKRERSMTVFFRSTTALLFSFVAGLLLLPPMEPVFSILGYRYGVTFMALLH